MLLRSRHPFALAILLAALAAVPALPATAWAQDDPPTEPADPPANDDGNDDDDDASLTDDAVAAFGREFEAAVNRKLTALFDYLDVPTVIQRGVADLNLPAEPMAEVIPELDKRMRPSAENVDGPIAGARLLRVLRVDDEPVLRFRYIADGVPDYADYTLGVVDGRIRIVDVLRHSRGARMSAQTRMVVLGMLRQREVELPEAAEAELRLFDRFSEVAGAMRRRDPATARRLYALLPDEVFDHPTIRHSARTLPCGLALVEGGPEAFDKQLQATRETRGSDLALEAWALSVLLGVGARELALSQLARVDALISDPWLDWCRAQVLAGLNRPHAAREAALQAVGRNAELAAAWLWLLDDALGRRVWSEAVMLLQQYEGASDQRPEDLRGWDELLRTHPDFAASDEFRRWTDGRTDDDDDGE